MIVRKSVIYRTNLSPGKPSFALSGSNGTTASPGKAWQIIAIYVCDFMSIFPSRPLLMFAVVDDELSVSCRVSNFVWRLSRCGYLSPHNRWEELLFSKKRVNQKRKTIFFIGRNFNARNWFLPKTIVKTKGTTCQGKGTIEARRSYPIRKYEVLKLSKCWSFRVAGC